ncbi:PAS domain S-box protein [Ramlibacter tataouinensis]|uniref:PAS domain S-box protein n=1 Tax=Ramlibacter tataouinensis TaxID=94132 RepID=UPI0022F3F578|nr:PAS domain S-box protein [Ramlibacter tataouinensis]WBY02683.1 PAS domain S-box protein [Ramlibacter tataouinensis]
MSSTDPSTGADAGPDPAATAAVPEDTGSGAGAVRAEPPDVTDLLLDAICVVDPNGRFLAIRGACEAIFGYGPHEMIGKPMIDFVYEGDRLRTLQAVTRIMDGYLQRHFENRYVRKDGRLVHIMWSARWVPQDGVRIAVARDITGRRDSADRAETLEAEDAAPRWKLCGSPPRLIPPGLSALPLSAQDHVVLLALGMGGGSVVSRRAIVEALGEDYLQYDQRRLDTQMRRLRRRVEQACGLKLPVTTVRGVGYRFFQPIEISA